MPNSEMDVSGLEAAREFVNELVTLGVFREIDNGLRILANAPLFVVPKPGQPGQWRCIADMKKGDKMIVLDQTPVFYLAPATSWKKCMLEGTPPSWIYRNISIISPLTRTIAPT